MEIRRPLHSEMEELIVIEDEATGLHAVLAIHSTLLGPAICDIRTFPYIDERDAIENATRVAPQSSYRSALANIPFGGACCAVMRRESWPQSRKAAFRLLGEFIDSLGGRVIAAGNLGTNPEDMDAIIQNTPFACGGSEQNIGDPSAYTALGLLQGIEAAVQEVWHTTSLSGLTVAVLGMGHVGLPLCERLLHAHAHLVVADHKEVNIENLHMALHETQKIEVLTAKEILSTPCDVFSPCALGDVLTDECISKLKCRVIAGSASCQLTNPHRQSRMLQARAILHIPGFAINSGGLYADACEILGYDSAQATVLANGIFETIQRILDAAAKTRKPPYEIALSMAMEKLRRARSKGILSNL